MAADPDGYDFWIHVTPRSRRAAVGGSHADALRVAVAAPAEDGRANEACARALAEAFGVDRREVELPANSRHRRKRVRIAGDPARLERRFCELAATR